MRAQVWEECAQKRADNHGAERLLMTSAGFDKTVAVTLRRSAACWVSKNMRQRSQVDTDSWHGLFDT